MSAPVYVANETYETHSAGIAHYARVAAGDLERVRRAVFRFMCSFSPIANFTTNESHAAHVRDGGMIATQSWHGARNHLMLEEYILHVGDRACAYSGTDCVGAYIINPRQPTEEEALANFKAHMTKTMIIHKWAMRFAELAHLASVGDDRIRSKAWVYTHTEEAAYATLLRIIGAAGFCGMTRAEMEDEFLLEVNPGSESAFVHTRIKELIEMRSIIIRPERRSGQSGVVYVTPAGLSAWRWRGVIQRPISR